MGDLPILREMAAQSGLTASELWKTVNAAIMPRGCTVAETLMFLAVAREYGLNPLTGEITPIKDKSGAIRAVVRIDGWLRKANENPQFDGYELEHGADDRGAFVEARVYRKDRSKPAIAREYLDECLQDKPAWKKYPSRMLSNKALVQAIRRAFGFAAIYDPDEINRIVECQPDPEGAEDSTAARMELVRERMDAAVKADAETDLFSVGVEDAQTEPIGD